tara:strand:+ start:149 stop:316 length:168 start_codon:yes stop_codon:yes gene_type:complete
MRLNWWSNVVVIDAYFISTELMALDKFTCTEEEAIHKLDLFYESLGFWFLVMKDS